VPTCSNSPSIWTSIEFWVSIPLIPNHILPSSSLTPTTNQGDPEDLAKAEEARTKVPEDIVQDFLWRRERNHQLTIDILETQSLENLFEKIFITLDDNAEYGLNKQEEEVLRRLRAKYQLENSVLIYPGADEVALSLLSNLASSEMGTTPVVLVIYRDPSSKDRIPNYEGQPLSQTVIEQIQAAGGVITEECSLPLKFLANSLKMPLYFFFILAILHLLTVFCWSTTFLRKFKLKPSSSP